MRRMRRVLWLLCAGAALAGGCRWRLGSEKDKEPPPPPVSQEAALREQIEDLRQQVATLKAENAIHTSRIKELLIRNEALAKGLREQQFANAQQEKQIEALAPAPKERDAYKAQVLELTMERARLARKVADLESLLTRLGWRGAGNASTQPSAP